MDRTRVIDWIARLATIGGLTLFAALLLGATPGWAAPTAPLPPPDITYTVAPPLPPKPQPCVVGNINKCVPPTLEPCFTLPGKPCKPPLTPPSDPPIKNPETPTSDPTTPSDPPDPATPARPATPTDPPSGIPTPNRIDTGAGSAESDTPAWPLWAVPALAALVLAAGLGGYWWLARTEQGRR